MDAALIALIDDLNRQRAAKPEDPVIARRWCSLAVKMGQYKKARLCIARFYTQETDPLRLADWSRLGGQAAFRELRLEEALTAFTVCLMHLSEISDGGQVPALPPQAGKENPFASGVAEALLWRTTAALAQAGFKAFPFAGTLLGLVREGKLLAADKDIDLGVWMEDYDACGAWLEAEGWIAVRNVPPYKAFRSFAHPATQLTLDLSGFQAMPEEHAVLGGFELEGYPPQYQNLRTFPWFELEPRKSPAGDLWFIKEPERVLAALYGDWRTPNPWWDGMVSDLCNNEFTLLVRCYAYDRLVARWMDGQLERAWAYAHQIHLQDATDFPALRAKKSLGKILGAISPRALNWPPTLPRASTS